MKGVSEDTYCCLIVEKHVLFAYCIADFAINNSLLTAVERGWAGHRSIASHDSSHLFVSNSLT